VPGCSTDSGIPDYRDSTGEWKRRPPIRYQEFVGNERARKRYWARSLAGFRRCGWRARTTRTTRSRRSSARDGSFSSSRKMSMDCITRPAARTSSICTDASTPFAASVAGNGRSRDELQRELERRNPSFAALDAVEAPDGDADLEGVAFETFDVPACNACGGLLKPDVVFFGENVPAERVQRAMAPIASSDAMLVVGSSLMIYSGYRFVTAAADAGKPIAAINLGRTRADDLLALKVEGTAARTRSALLTS
jgi:NAD-dependent SIR2 family protein deacetylase